MLALVAALFVARPTERDPAASVVVERAAAATELTAVRPSNPFPRDAVADRDTEQAPPLVVASSSTPPMDPRHRALAEHFADAFGREPRAADWATPKEAEITGFFADAADTRGSRLLAVDCRSTMCRLRVAHNDGDALQRFTGATGLHGPLSVEGIRFPDPDPTSSVVYLAREQGRLPWPEERAKP